MINDEVKARVVAKVSSRFRTFGGGRGSEFNPIAEALKEHAPVFAAGVDVAEVVEFVISAYYSERYQKVS